MKPSFQEAHSHQDRTFQHIANASNLVCYSKTKTVIAKFAHSYNVESKKYGGKGFISLGMRSGEDTSSRRVFCRWKIPERVADIGEHPQQPAPRCHPIKCECVTSQHGGLAVWGQRVAEGGVCTRGTAELTS